MKAKKGFYYRGIHTHGALYEMVGYWDGKILETLVDNDDMWFRGLSWDGDFKRNSIKGLWEFIHE